MKGVTCLHKPRAALLRLWDRLRNTRPARAVQRLFALCERHSFLTQCLLLLLYRLSLDVIYVTMLSPIYGYERFTLSIEPLFYLCTWLTLLVFAPFVVRIGQSGNPSSLLVTLINYLFFLPLTSYCGCHGGGMGFFLIAVVYWAALLFFQLCLPVLTLRRPALHHSRTFMTGLTVFACVLILYISGRYTGFRLFLHVIDVYDVRREAAGYAIPTLLSYLLGTMPIVMALVLLYWAMRRKWLPTAALCAVYLFYYSIAAQKSVFFFAVLLFLCFFFFRDWMLRYLGGLLTLLPLSALAEYKLLGSEWIHTLFLRRLMFLPVQICEQYHDYFLQHPLNLNRADIMSRFSFAPIYSANIPRVLGEFRNHPLENANSGLLGDLFANFPTVPGVLLLPLILVICFRLLDLTAYPFRRRITLPICLYFAFGFISTTWSTVLLTHGFLLTCLLFYLYPNEEELSHA